MVTTDKTYCASSFLTFRTIADRNKCFVQGIKPRLWENVQKRYPIYQSEELEEYLYKSVRNICKQSKTALALSGGIDSAILAKFMPEGSVAYTFKCVAPGTQVTDETETARKYAKECGLEHRIVEIYWEDFEKYAPALMHHKGMPIHSIEVQIYKAALQAKEDGMESFLFGESSDVTYGGMSGLLSRDWTVGEFYDRYSYVRPYQVLKEFDMIMEPYLAHVKDGKIDVHDFCSTFYFEEAMGSYTNACRCAGIEFKAPYSETVMAVPLDMQRVRAGENKYLVREVFQRLYPNFEIPSKIPMPRPMNEWMQNWNGPKRQEFWPHCTDHMTGDQKWLVWCLEKFWNMEEKGLFERG